MHLHKKQQTEKALAFLVILLVSTLFAALSAPQVFAEVSISELSDSEGFVGDLVELSGQINTINGSYEILFDGSPVKTGDATLRDVEDEFLIPNTTTGDHDVQLRDVVNATESVALTFAVKTQYVVKGPRVQEGENVTIVAEITGGEANQTSRTRIMVEDQMNVTYSSDEFIIQTDQAGYGNATRMYPTEFGGNPHTFFVGIYNISLVDTLNETLATGNFTIGLTDATNYHRFQTVFVQAANYTSAAALTIEITHVNETVQLVPSNASGPMGIITANWTIPANASIGSYRLEVLYTKPVGIEKPIADKQNFTVVSKSFTCEVKTFNLDNEPVKGVLVEVNNITTPAIETEFTKEGGVTSFLLKATNYTFKAFWNVSQAPRAQVGETAEISLARNLTGASAINITISLAHMKVAIKDENGEAIPFVEVWLSFTYISRLNVPITPIPIYSETNLTGTGIFRNVFTNVNYTIEARRYGYTFSTFHLNLTSTSWVDMTCPTYELAVKVYDRDGEVLQNVEVKAYDWSIGLGGLVGTKTTGTNGEVAFNLTFGKYFLSTYKDTMLLNRTTVLLVNQPTNFAVHCKLYKLSLDINVLDYFGQGISNAKVTLEREGTILLSSNTGANGEAQFTELVGGNYKIYVHIGEKPYGITTLHLQEPKTVTIKMGGLVSIGGLVAETSHFIAVLSIPMVITAFLLFFLYRKFQSSQEKE